MIIYYILCVTITKYVCELCRTLRYINISINILKQIIESRISKTKLKHKFKKRKKKEYQEWKALSWHHQAFSSSSSSSRSFLLSHFSLHLSKPSHQHSLSRTQSPFLVISLPHFQTLLFSPIYNNPLYHTQNGAFHIKKNRVPPKVETPLWPMACDPLCHTHFFFFFFFLFLINLGPNYWESLVVFIQLYLFNLWYVWKKAPNYCIWIAHIYITIGVSFCSCLVACSSSLSFFPFSH